MIARRSRFVVAALACARMAIALGCSNGGALDAMLQAPRESQRFHGFVTSGTSHGVCVLPLAKACNGACPSLESVVAEASLHLVLCSPHASGESDKTEEADEPERQVMWTGALGDYRYVKISGGYTGVTDWFDASGAMIGEERHTDATKDQMCDAEAAIFGHVPRLAEPLHGAASCLEDPEKFPKELFDPKWRNVSPP